MKYLIILVFLSACSLSPKYMTELKPAEDFDFYKIAWNKAFDPQYDSGNLPIGLTGVTLSDGILYVGTPKGEMNAFDLDNGRTLWSFREGFSFHAAPTVHRNNVFYGTSDGRLFSRNKLSGKLNFAIDLGNAIEAAPTLYEGRLVVHLRDHRIVTLDAETGKILWAYRRSVPYKTTVQRASKPLVLDNKVYIGFADGFLVAIALQDGAILWEQKLATASKFIDVDMSPLAVGNKLIVGSQSANLKVLSLSTGETLRQLDYKTNRKPLQSGSSFVLGTLDGEVVLIDRYFQTKKTKTISEGSITGIKEWKNYFAITTSKGEFFLLDKVSLKVLHRKHLGSKVSSVFSGLETSDGKLALYSSRNRLYVFQ